jgi:hypothetical protein
LSPTYLIGLIDAAMSDPEHRFERKAKGSGEKNETQISRD